MGNTTQTLGTQFTIAGLAEATTALLKFGQLVKSTQASFSAYGKMPSNKQTRSVQAQPGQPVAVPMQPGTIYINVNITGGNGGSSGQSSSGGTGSGSARRRPGAYGPNQRYRDLLTDLRNPAVKNDHARFQDTVRALDRVERQLKVPNTFMSKVMGVMKSTRVNLGPVSPLIGQLMQLGAAAGPEGEAVAMVMAAEVALAAAFYSLATKSAELGNQFTRMQYSLGSNAGTTAQLQTIGSALGLSPDTMSSIAQSFQNAITSDPMSRAAGMRLGVFNLPGMFGNQDIGSQMVTAITNLRNITNTTERTAIARQTNLQALLPLAALSPRQFGYMASDSGIRSSLMTAQFQTQAADFQAAMGRVGDALNNVMIALGPSTLPVINGFLDTLADNLQSLAVWIQANQGTITKFINTIANSNPYIVANRLAHDANDPGNFMTKTQAVLQTLSQIGSPADYNGLGQSSQSSALQANTDATRANTQAIRAMIPGTYGTTRRDMRAALPTGLNGESIGRSALNLSAF